MKERKIFLQIFTIKFEENSVEIHCPNCWTLITRYQKNFYWIDLWFDPEGSNALALYVDCVGCGKSQVACPLAFESEDDAHDLIASFAWINNGKIPSHYGLVSSEWTKHTPLDAAIAIHTEQLRPYSAIQLQNRLVIKCEKCDLEHASLPEGTLIVGSPLEQSWLVLRDVCSSCQCLIIVPIVVGVTDLAPDAIDIGAYSGWPWQLLEVKQ